MTVQKKYSFICIGYKPAGVLYQIYKTEARGARYRSDIRVQRFVTNIYILLIIFGPNVNTSASFYAASSNEKSSVESKNESDKE